MQVSDPQRLTMPDNYAAGFVDWIVRKGLDPHEFSTAYVERTEQLGYPPDLHLCAQMFVKEGVVS